MPFTDGEPGPGSQEARPCFLFGRGWQLFTFPLALACTPFTVPVLSPTVPVPTCATGLEYSGSVSAQHSKASEDLAKSNLGSHLLTANKSSCLWSSLVREEATEAGGNWPSSHMTGISSLHLFKIWKHLQPKLRHTRQRLKIYYNQN